MKNINDFVNLDYPFEYVRELYEIWVRELEELKQNKESYDKRYCLDKKTSLSEELTYSSQLNFSEQLDLDRLLKMLIDNNHGLKYKEVDLNALRRHLLDIHPDVEKYNELIDKINAVSDNISGILLKCITFKNLKEKKYSDLCNIEHTFIKNGHHLTCIFCGATTKGYKFNKNDFDFLVKSALKKGCLIKEATKNDLPLIEVLKEKREIDLSERKDLDFDVEEDLVLAEKYEFEDKRFIENIKKNITLAHQLDSQMFDNPNNEVKSQYLANEKAQELMNKIDTELEKIQKIDSRFKNLMIEDCKIARYEILILSGHNIPNLLEQTKDEDDRIALTKAYYNISNQKFRVNSDYFADKYEALLYPCATANIEINNRILQMRLRRN